MKNKKISIGRISYINASPVYYGLDNNLVDNFPVWLKMVSDVPSVLNKKIMNKEIVVSPISSITYAQNYKELLILPNLSISCKGRVLSVILLSNYSIENLDSKKVILSNESATAAGFLKMICLQKKIFPVFQSGSIKDISKIANTDAVLVIGDTALKPPWDLNFKYSIDLGSFWFEITKMPFVFALWVVKRSFAKKNPKTIKTIHNLLLESKNKGYQNIEKIIVKRAKQLGLKQSVIKEYFDLLYCDLDKEKIRAVDLFFCSLFQMGLLKEKPVLNFFK